MPLPASLRREWLDRVLSVLAPMRAALERIIAHSHVFVPEWTSGTHRIAYNAWRLQTPATMPPYAQGEAWAIDTWWAKSGASH